MVAMCEAQTYGLGWRKMPGERAWVAQSVENTVSGLQPLEWRA